jgi:hypothetical protein
MADTGAPFFLPFPLSTDLVTDGAQAIEDLADAVAAELDLIPAGIGSNVVQTVKTDAFTTTGRAEPTGYRAVITPSSTSSKILIIVAATISGNDNTVPTRVHLMRGTTEIALGDSAGSRTRAAMAGSGGFTRDNASASIVFLDSPSTTSAVTYRVELSSFATSHLNRSRNDDDSSIVARTISTITVIEVAV